ncbi:MAG: hypothetical protein H7328_11215 [Bdellovibrio sp.]|nr:hypothetical protein [Bdellovibrio sp.]
MSFFFAEKNFASTYVFRSARVESFIDHQKITAISERDDWEVGEILPVVSRNAKLGVVGFVEVNSVRALSPTSFELRLKLLRQSRKYFIQTGDVIRRMDLSVGNPDYIGSTDLIIHQNAVNVSSKYRPLVYQGFVIGDTAQTLYNHELMINYFGNLLYGFNDWLTLGTLTTANIFGKPNASFKARVYDSESTTLATGLSFVRLEQEGEASLNLNLYWDSISSDALISHTFVSLGLIKWEKAADSAAIKALGSSSFQSGYELILNNWDRFLVGPSYNFEKKALGGYLSYVWIADRVHAQISINATDITHLRLDPQDGYYGFFDLYWRF